MTRGINIALIVLFCFQCLAIVKVAALHVSESRGGLPPADANSSNDLKEHLRSQLSAVQNLDRAILSGTFDPFKKPLKARTPSSPKVKPPQTEPIRRVLLEDQIGGQLVWQKTRNEVSREFADLIMALKLPAQVAEHLKDLITDLQMAREDAQSTSFGISSDKIKKTVEIASEDTWLDIHALLSDEQFRSTKAFYELQPLRSSLLHYIESPGLGEPTFPEDVQQQLKNILANTLSASAVLDSARSNVSSKQAQTEQLLQEAKTVLRPADWERLKRFIQNKS